MKKKDSEIECVCIFMLDRVITKISKQYFDRMDVTNVN